MEKSFDVLTIGDCCVDLIITGKDIIPEFGQKDKIVNKYILEMGGSCTIFACQAAKLGLKTAVIGKVGDDPFGEKILNTLKEAGVSIKFMDKTLDTKTGMTVVINNKEDRAMLTYIGTIDSIEKSNISDELLESVRHLHIGSYYLMKKLQPHYLEIVKKLKKYEVTISLDPNWDPAENWDGNISRLLPYIDIFLPNERELLAITHENKLEKAIPKLRSTIPIIVVKCGEKGAIAYRDAEYYKISALKAQVLDTIGAGDNFDAGFVYGFLENKSIKECLQIGTICGGLSTRAAGGVEGQPRLRKMLEFLTIFQ